MAAGKDFNDEAKTFEVFLVSYLLLACLIILLFVVGREDSESFIVWSIVLDLIIFFFLFEVRNYWAYAIVFYIVEDLAIFFGWATFFAISNMRSDL